MKTILYWITIASLTAVPVFGQATGDNKNPDTQKPCIAADEPIYSVTKGVKPPKVEPAKPETHNFQGALEIVLNSAGKVCQVKILNGNNESAARDLVDAVSRRWKFQPATKDGKPVAVRMRINFTSHQ